MNDIEIQAQEYLRRREWRRAAELFDKLLAPTTSNGIPRERVVGYLLGRSECCLELGQHEAVVSDCRRIIKLLADADCSSNNGARARRRLVHALFSLRRFSEAEAAAREWLVSGGGATNQPEALKMLERLRIVLQMANGQKCTQPKCMPQQRLNEEVLNLGSQLESWTGLAECSRRQRKHPVELIGDISLPRGTNLTDITPLRRTHPVELENNIELGSFQQQAESGSVLPANEIPEEDNTLNNMCSYCCLTFRDRTDLRLHCQSESHQTVIMSDEGRDWKWRPPPRGLTSNAYSLCESWAEGNASCRYGAQCVEAHGAEELAEWRERFEYRKMKLQRACEKELYGKSYTEQLLEKWVQAPSPEKVMREKLDGVEESCSAELVTTVSSKASQREWVFTLQTSRLLRAVALLQDAHRNHFFLRHVSTGDPSLKMFSEWEPTNNQEWSIPSVFQIEGNHIPLLKHTVTVAFSTDIYGTFRQSVVFDFGGEPVLVRHLCVDVVPVTDVDRMKELKKELVLSAAERWDSSNAEIIPFSSPVTPLVPTPAGIAKDSEWERELLNAYPSPRAETFALTHSTVTEKKLTRNNYRARMHELLCVEEMARYEQVARYNLTAKLRLAECYLLAPNGVATSTAKYAHSGELFALMNLGKDVSEDTSAGRLILNNCTTVLVAASNPVKQDTGSSQAQKRADNPTEVNEDGTKRNRVVYEALIEDKGKNMIYLRLSAATVCDLKMKPDTEFLVDVQFQLNRIPYCEWHYAIDKIADFRVIFPDTYLEPSIPWTPQRQWSEILDSRLNLKQKEAIVAITTAVNYPLPPILIIGPFGTGKTYTLAQAIKQLLLQSDTRVLVCTHSNSAADLYIKDYLHPYVEAGHEEARPLRIYYHKRWVATVNQVVQKYCLIETNGGVKTFRVPTLDDIMKHRVIVVTLSISMYLSTLGLQKGYFSHILLDEAAQAMECEAIMPLSLANEDTRIVLAGDHMQLSPELFSHFAKERNLHVSLLERLYDHYPTTFPCKILLCENYRAHEAIIQFTSELFYEQKLISSGKQPRHEQFYPLTFFTARGEDVQDINSTAFYNNSEVYEVVERVCELRKKWPPAWGKMDDQSIGIMTPYADQVFRIRSELRKRRMGGISVERVLNVQGKQFRAIFLSTVRTRRTCHSGTKSSAGGDDMDYGFLSNSKLLNTAITRAQSLVAVVGDPVALCSIGRCRKVWERFIEICNQNKSLFGITWSYLRSQLDGVELKKTYVLNPLAPEFIPRQFQAESYIRLPSLLGPYGGGGPGLISPLRFPQPRFPQPRMPPYIPPGLYPYPLYYCPPHPMRPPLVLPPHPPPPPPLPPPGPSVNSWGYPLISPPSSGPMFGAGRSTPVGWSPGNKKKPEPKQENGRVPLVQVPNRSPALKPSQFTGPVPSSVPQSPGNSNPIPDTYVPGGVISPTSFLHPPGPYSTGLNPQEPAQIIGAFGPLHIPCGEKTSAFDQQQAMINPRIEERDDKPEQVQFLNNVHFPEQLQAPPNRPQDRIPDWNPLLPPNISLPELLESQPKQIEWYNHLMETAGIEAATKFMELLINSANNFKLQRPPKPATPSTSPPPPPDMIRTLEELFNEKNLGPPIIPQEPPPPQPLPPQQPAMINAKFAQHHFQQIPLRPMPALPERAPWFPAPDKPLGDLPLLPNMMNKPLLLRDLEASMVLAAGCGPQVLAPQQQQQPPQIDAAANFGSNPNIREPNFIGNNNGWQPPRQHSVPLYQRQAQSSMQENVNVHSILDGVMDKSTSGTSGAFAGYARAAVSIGLQRDCPQREPAVNFPRVPQQQEHSVGEVPAGRMMQMFHHPPDDFVHAQNNQQQQNAREFGKPEGQSEDEMAAQNDGIGTTYASVLRATPQKLNSSLNEDEDKGRMGDPFAVLRALGAKSTQSSTGLYHYFS